MDQILGVNQTPVVPPALAATAGDHDGGIDLSWDTVADAKSYVMEKSPYPPTPTSWAHAGVSTKSRMTITTLASRTHATGSASPPSAPAGKAAGAIPPPRSHRETAR